MKTAMVVGGVRFSTNENPNPTIPFVFLGDSFRSAAFGLDQAWIAIRPLEDRSRISLTLGRMPNQTWRGTAGTQPHRDDLGRRRQPGGPRPQGEDPRHSRGARPQAREPHRLLPGAGDAGSALRRPHRQHRPLRGPAQGRDQVRHGRVRLLRLGEPEQRPQLTGPRRRRRQRAAADRRVLAPSRSQQRQQPLRLRPAECDGLREGSLPHPQPDRAGPRAAPERGARATRTST